MARKTTRKPAGPARKSSKKAAASPRAAGGKPSGNPELTREVGVLAKQVGAAIMSAAHSREAADIGAEVSRSMRAIGDRVAKAVKKASHGHDRRQEASELGCEISRGAKTVGSKVAKAVKTAAQSPAISDITGQTKKVVGLSKEEGLKAAKKLRENLHAGIAAASQELQRLAEKIKQAK